MGELPLALTTAMSCTCCSVAPNQVSWQALWRGNGANVFRLVPEVGLRFLLNDQLETLFSPIDGSPPTLATHIAAGWQAFALCVMPIEQAVAYPPDDPPGQTQVLQRG